LSTNRDQIFSVVIPIVRGMVKGRMGAKAAALRRFCAAPP
jgi:hypothetical protein